MATVIWSGPALRLVREIGQNIGRDKPRAAGKWVRRIMLAPDILATMPHRGAVVEEFDLDHIRELQVGPYRVIYVVSADTCTVAAVIHGRQDLMSRFDPDDFPA